MTQTIEARLAEHGITLPEAAAPAANYAPFIVSGNLVFISGQVPIEAGSIRYQGKLGAGMSVEDGQAAARLCAINILAQAKVALGNLENIGRLLKLTGFVNSAPDFGDQPQVINGASDFLVEILGEKGRHARAAVGVSALPFGVAVEIEAIIEAA